MTDLEALERTAKAAHNVGEAWLTHDDLTGVYPETMAFIVEASPAAILSLLSAHRAALAKLEWYEKAISDCQVKAATNAERERRIRSNIVSSAEIAFREIVAVARTALTEAP